MCNKNTASKKANVAFIVVGVIVCVLILAIIATFSYRQKCPKNRKTEKWRKKKVGKLANSPQTEMLQLKDSLNVKHGGDMITDQLQVMSDTTISVVPSKTIRNPLVIVIGIGDYEEKTLLPKLQGIRADYNNIISVFEEIYNYTVLIATGADKENNNPKLFWTHDQIFEYLDEARRKIVQDKHDSLISIISCHGATNQMNEECLIDSNGSRINLELIFSYFSAKSDRNMLNKPKIFFIDCCRNQDGTLPQPALPYIQHKGTNDISTNVNRQRFLSDELSLDAYFYTVYSTSKGYATIEGENGGFLIRNVKKVFEHYQECVHNKHLRDVVEQIKIQVQDEFKHGLGTNIPEDRSTGALKIYFEKNDKP